ncbi:MAG: DOPA 4,5-dioxygenase family protein [Comamonas sp.]
MPDTPAAANRLENRYARYHAHVYFDAASVAQARALCAAAGERFGVRVGRVHEKRVGPHPCWSCQLAFDSHQFDALVAWLDAHRGGLDVLLHGDTGDDLADHTAHVGWLGRSHVLDLSAFR